MTKHQKNKSTEVPRCPDDIVNRILHFGNFKNALDSLHYLLASEDSSSIVIQGKAGIGKSSLVHEAMKNCDVLSIWMRPCHFTDDFSALKYIAEQLKVPTRTSLQEILEDIEERCLKTTKKIVIVLPQFEEFCRKRQSFLYCLTNLTQHGVNIGLIGLTYSLDSTEHLEKRVRSRINALFYHLDPPYDSFQEYVEFASLLLGDRKNKLIHHDHLIENLGQLYGVGDRSIRDLKRFLISAYTWNKQGKMVLKESLWEDDALSMLEDRVRWLTESQLELLKMALAYCYRNKTVDFTLADLQKFARVQNNNHFDSVSTLAIRNAGYLVRNSFFAHVKSQKMIDKNSTLTAAMLPTHFKIVMLEHPEYHKLRTDSLWKHIK